MLYLLMSSFTVGETTGAVEEQGYTWEHSANRWPLGLVCFSLLVAVGERIETRMPPVTDVVWLSHP